MKIIPYNDYEIELFSTKYSLYKNVPGSRIHLYSANGAYVPPQLSFGRIIFVRFEDEKQALDSALSHIEKLEEK